MIEDEFLLPCGFCETAISGKHAGTDAMHAMCRLHRAILYLHVRLITAIEKDYSNKNYLDRMLSLPQGKQIATWNQIEARVREVWSRGFAIMEKV